MPLSHLDSTALPDSSIGIGHNSGAIQLRIEIRMFNRIYQSFGNGEYRRSILVVAGTSVGDLLAQFGIPESEIFIAFVNGSDVSESPGKLRLDYMMEDGDVLALSGAVPYSWGYGAPVV